MAAFLTLDLELPLPSLSTHFQTITIPRGSPAAIAGAMPARDDEVIGGFSFGARVATHLAAKAYVLVGFPFHQRGKPEVRRVHELEQAEGPVLILQGERDAHGDRARVSSWTLPEHVTVRWLEGARHRPSSAHDAVARFHVETFLAKL